MNTKRFFQLRFSLFFIGLLTAISFALGFSYSKLPDMPKSQKSVLTFVGGPAIFLGFLAFINWMITQENKLEVDEEVKKQLDEQLDLSMNEFVTKYSDYIQDIEQKVKTLDMSKEARTVIDQSFAKLEVSKESFKNHLKSCQAIVNWLDIESNQFTILSAAISEVAANFEISEQYMNSFKKDIRECLKWLRWSIYHSRACELEKEKYTSAKPGILNQNQAYIMAINIIKREIKREPKLQKFIEKTPAVDKLIDYLIDNVFDDSKQSE